MIAAGRSAPIADKLPDLQSAVLSPARRPRRSSDERRSDRYLGARSDPWSPHQSHLWTGWECFPHLVARRQMDRILLCPKRSLAICRKPSDAAARKSVCSTLSSSPGSTIGRTTVVSAVFAARPGRPLSADIGLALQGERKPSLVVERGTAGNFLQTAIGSPTSRPSRAGRKFTPCPLARQGKWQVSANGGQQPRWSKTAKNSTIWTDLQSFRGPGNECGGALQFGRLRKLISNWSAPQVFYDVSPDGKKFLLDRVEQQVSQSVTVVTNFTAGLKNKTSGGFQSGKTTCSVIFRRIFSVARPNRASPGCIPRTHPAVPQDRCG